MKQTQTEKIALMAAFYVKYEGWHTYASTMKKTAKRLESIGILELNEFRQARFTGKCI